MAPAGAPLGRWPVTLFRRLARDYTAGEEEVLAQSCPGGTMAEATLSPEMLELVAERFKVLAEPARLRLLDTLRQGERSVSELISATGLRQANVSKHLQLLHAAGFVGRRKVGLHVYYFIADPEVFQLCDLMCGRLKAEVARRQAVVAAV